MITGFLFCRYVLFPIFPGYARRAEDEIDLLIAKQGTA